MRETLELQKKAFIENGQPSYNQRLDSLKRCIALLETHDVQIVEALNEDYKNRSETEIMTSEVIQSIRNLNFTIKNLKKWMKPSRRPSSFMADLLGSKALMQPSPLGTVGIIAPWNFPIGMVFYPTASILAAGNRIMVKPSEFTPNTASLIKEAVGKYFDESEFAVFLGGPEVGAEFTALPLDHLLYTGSGAVARKVVANAATNLVPTTLELGGKSANVALNDADPVLVAKKAIGACHQNSGQTCSALTRLIIPKSMSEEVYKIIADKNDTYSVGDPLDENTRCGPMVSLRQQKSVTKYIESGINEGATLISGGLGKPDGIIKGYYVKPTVFADVTPEMKIWKEEIFGPVLVITTYDDEDEAIMLANDSVYGLSGGVWSKDEERAIRFAKLMRTGQVSVNGGAFNISAPFGGYKHSGNGRELGTHGLDEFLEIKSIQL